MSGIVSITVFPIQIQIILIRHNDVPTLCSEIFHQAWNIRIEAIDAVGRSSKWSFDGEGNLLSHQDPRGPDSEWTYEYDGANRLKKKTDPEDGEIAELRSNKEGFELYLDPELEPDSEDERAQAMESEESRSSENTSEEMSDDSSESSDLDWEP